MKASAERLRSLPSRVESVLAGADDAAIRQRPGDGEWSAIEVIGHLIDKMQFWSERVERIAREDRPALQSYDQDAYVRERGYQSSSLGGLMRELRSGCEQFASLVESVPEAALAREGVHQEMGPIRLAQCVQIPIDSADEHLNQMRAALAAARSSAD